MGAVIFSLPVALIGAAYYTMTFGLGLPEAFGLYVVLGTLVMAGITLINSAVRELAKVYNNPAMRAR